MALKYERRKAAYCGGWAMWSTIGILGPPGHVRHFPISIVARMIFVVRGEG
jgi:hypothetical protein